MPYPKVASDTMPNIIDLCKKLAPNNQPIYLNIEIINGAIENECYKNVESQIKNQGGSIQYGWQIWETIPDLMAEAEFHAVWVDNNGKFHDLTPKSLQGIDRILFLPDSVRKYSDRQIDNVRISLQDDDLIKKFIENAEKCFKAINRGELASYHGYIVADADSEIQKLMKEKEELLIKIIQKFFS
ncbi:zinc chelation protein SecC [Patescibacteria group bacterium]